MTDIHPVDDAPKTTLEKNDCVEKINKHIESNEALNVSDANEPSTKNVHTNDVTPNTNEPPSESGVNKIIAENDTCIENEDKINLNDKEENINADTSLQEDSKNSKNSRRNEESDRSFENSSQTNTAEATYTPSTDKNKENETNKINIDNKEEENQDEEEDIPESFFDDLMSEDFIEGLNVVDAWDGDEIARKIASEKVLEKMEIMKSTEEKKLIKEIQPAHEESKSTKGGIKSVKKKIKLEEQKKSNQDENDNRSENVLEEEIDTLKNLSSSDLRNRIRALKQMERELRKSKKRKYKDYEQKVKSDSKEREHKRSRRRSKSKDHGDLNSRRDPSKTQRDILKDKDKCEKDKTTKMIYEKLKTGLVPPGMETEMDVEPETSAKSNKLEDGELATTDKESSHEKKLAKKNTESKKDKPTKSEHSVRSPRKDTKPRSSPKARSPQYRKIRSRSRSPRRYRSPRKRSRTPERRSRRLSPRRSRSRSLELRRKYRYRSRTRSRSRSLSLLRKTSPLARRNEKLFKEIDILKSKLYSDVTHSTHSPRNIELELTQGIIPQNTHMNIPPQHFMNPPHQFQPPLSTNQNFVPLQPVPPPQPVELDQSFFIGQSNMNPNCQYPLSVPPPQGHVPSPMMQPVGLPGATPHFQQNWPMEQQSKPPQEHINFFNSSSQLNMNQNFSSHVPPASHSMNLMDSQVPVPQQQSIAFMEQPATPQSALVNEKKQNEDEIFAKLFADNKITLSDYLSVTAKTIDKSNPVDIQNKIKVISHCQEALNEINGNAKTVGRFLPRKAQKTSIKLPLGDGLSPFKKVPVVKFQFTTYMKQSGDKPVLASSLNRLMIKLGKDIQFEEPQVSLPLLTPKLSQNESQKVVKSAIPQISKKVELEVMKWKTSHSSTQTDAVAMVDFGCQFNCEELQSPLKSAMKKQSLAKLTPAQLLAQAAHPEMSPPRAPPAPKWTPPPDVQRNRWFSENDIHRDFSDDQNNRGYRIPDVFSKFQFSDDRSWSADVASPFYDSPTMVFEPPSAGGFFDKTSDRSYFGHRH